MSELRLDLLARFGAEAYQPVTFLERGVTVPFTTPFLFGARIRPNHSRGGLELVIANPSGGRGFYIVPWPALTEVCAPTLHDRRLWQRLSEETAITPSLVREVARSVAAEGLAGREAAAAASRAREAETNARMRANSLLQLDLIRRTETPEEAAVPPEADTPANLERRAKRAVARFAPRLGVSPEVLAASLESIAGAIAGIGVPADPTPSRTRGLATRLRSLMQEVEQWLAASPDPKEQHAAQLVMDAARLALRCAEAAFADLDAELGDTTVLLRTWQENQTPLLRRVTRPDWLLDGWDVILELWRDADPETRGGTLSEMALLVPEMPREVEEWLGIAEEWDRPRRLRRLVRANEDWRAGRMIELIARNERLWARAI